MLFSTKSLNLKKLLNNRNTYIKVNAFRYLASNVVLIGLELNIHDFKNDWIISLIYDFL
jgi:hypothetical protein